MALPWEFLHDGQDFQFACRNTLISRMPQKVAAFKSNTSNRSCACWCWSRHPTIRRFPTQSWRERILEAVDKFYVDNKIDMDFTEDATFETIQSYLNENMNGKSFCRK